MLKGKVAIVTGGSRGLGRAIAFALAEGGARVAVAARTREDLERTVSAIADMGGQAVAVRADVSDAGDLVNLVRAVEMKFGGADVLVNNAGIIGPVGPLWEVPTEKFDECMSVNFRSMLLISRLVIPGMIKKRGGKIINVTSGLAEYVVPRLGAHSVSKAAVNQLTRALARELEDHNIQVLGMDPGTVDTPMQEALRGMGVDELGAEAHRIFWALKEGGHLKPPEQAAKLAVFLASERTDDITGEVGTESHFLQWGYRLAA